MARPQSEHLQRSGNTPIDPDHIATEVQTQPHAPRDEPGGGPVPVENQPGHHPAEDQDKPDLDQFAERLGVSPADRDVDELDNEDETTPGVSNDGDVERGDHADASGRTDPGDRSPASTLASAALNLAGRARDLAGPVGRIVSERVDQVTGAVGDYRHLAERVERLEAEVAQLQRDANGG